MVDGASMCMSTESVDPFMTERGSRGCFVLEVTV